MRLKHMIRPNLKGDFLTKYEVPTFSSFLSFFIFDIYGTTKRRCDNGGRPSTSTTHVHLKEGCWVIAPRGTDS